MARAIYVLVALALAGPALGLGRGQVKSIRSASYTPGHGEIKAVPGFDGPLPSKCDAAGSAGDPPQRNAAIKCKGRLCTKK